MSKAYWVAHVTVTDPARYAGYMELAPAAFKKYGARFLARGVDAQTLEGEAWQRHVVIEFDDMDRALACYNSPEYRAARALREGVCKASVTLVNGLGDQGHGTGQP